MEKAKQEDEAQRTATVVQRLQRKLIEIKTEPISPLIVHHFSDKSRKEIRDRESAGSTRRTRSPRTDKMRTDEFIASVYVSENGWHGIPAGGFKKGLVRAGKMMGLNMTDLRQMFFVVGDGREQNGGMELIKLLNSKGKPFDWKKNKPEMREDYVRVKTGTTLRYRAEYWPWHLKLVVEFDPSIIAPESIVALVERSGFSVGQCEWRVEKDGDYGRFRIAA